MSSHRLSFNETLCHFESKGCLDKIGATASLSTTCTVLFVCVNVLIVKQMIKQDAHLMTKWKFCRTLLNVSTGNTEDEVQSVSNLSKQNYIFFPQTTSYAYFSFPVTFPAHTPTHDAVILSDFGNNLCNFTSHFKMKLNLITD